MPSFFKWPNERWSNESSSVLKLFFSDLKRANRNTPCFNLEIQRTLLHFVISTLCSKESAWMHSVLLKVTRKVLCRRSHWCCCQKMNQKGRFLLLLFNHFNHEVFVGPWSIELHQPQWRPCWTCPHTEVHQAFFFSAHPSLLRATCLSLSSNTAAF